MDITQLDEAVQFYLGKCVAPSTFASYASAQCRFRSFCQASGIQPPFPVKEETLCHFAAHLGQQHLKHRTIKCYLSGIRFAQIHLSLGDPFRNKAMPRLEYVLSGIKQVQARSAAPPKPRLPITPELLAHIRSVWLKAPRQPDLIMLWAAACVGFFGFLRAAEFTVHTLQGYDPEVHLSLQDVAIDSHSSPSVVRLHIKQSKTDPLRQGVDIFLGATYTTICPVQAILLYLEVRSPAPGPLFMFQSGSPLTRSALVSHLQTALQSAGVFPAAYTGHSFRIGAATTAAKCGVEDSLIQTLGRWKSAAYLAYIKIPRQQLASVSKTLVSHSPTPQ